MSQKQYKAMRQLALLQTVGMPVEETLSLYKKFKKRLASDRRGTQAMAKVIKTRSHGKARSFSGEIPKASPPALQPYPRSRIVKGFKSDNYSHTKGYKRQSNWVSKLFLTGFTPWTMGVL